MNYPYVKDCAFKFIKAVCPTADELVRKDI